MKKRFIVSIRNGFVLCKIIEMIATANPISAISTTKTIIRKDPQIHLALENQI